MSLIYTVIARGEVMLVEYTSFCGNFVMTAQQVLQKCTPDRRFVKYSANNYIFYVLYIELIYMVMCDFKYSERIAFAYLEKMHKLFTAVYSEERLNRMGMYGCLEFAPTLKSNMELYNTPEEVDNVARLWKETEEVNQIINEDLQKLIERGEKIEVLVKKTETMSSLSLDMRNTSKTIKHEMTWRNWKTTIMIVLIAALAVYILFVMVCGSFSLSGCF